MIRAKLHSSSGLFANEKISWYSKGNIFLLMNHENTSQESEEKIPSKKKVPKLLVLSIAFFVAVLILTGFLVYENMQLDQAIANKQSDISLKDQAITELKNDPQVQAMDVLQRTKGALDREIVRSNAANYVREIEALHAKYGVNFTGFSFSSELVNTSISAPTGVTGDAMSKTVQFIRDYRDNTASGSFILGPVTSVAGGPENRSFSVEFKIK